MKKIQRHIKFNPSPTHLLVGSVIMFGLSLLTLATAALVTYKDTSSAKPQQPFAVGTKVSQGLVDVTVSDIRHSAGSKPFVAPQGQRYIIARLTIKNNADHAINVLPANDTYIKATDGSVRFLTINNLSEPLRGGSLPPGEQIRGDVSYLADLDKEYKLFVDSIWSGAALPFALKQ